MPESNTVRFLLDAAPEQKYRLVVGMTLLKKSAEVSAELEPLTRHRLKHGDIRLPRLMLLASVAPGRSVSFSSRPPASGAVAQTTTATSSDGWSSIPRHARRERRWGEGSRGFIAPAAIIVVSLEESGACCASPGYSAAEASAAASLHRTWPAVPVHTRLTPRRISRLGLASTTTLLWLSGACAAKIWRRSRPVNLNHRDSRTKGSAPPWC